MSLARQSDKTLDRLPRKLIHYAEILAEGIHTMTAAAIRAGYSPKVADKQAFLWIGRSRGESRYPYLFDYYEKLRRVNLRQFNVQKENILKELVLLGFSDITRFVDLPSVEYENRKYKAIEISEAHNALRDWANWLEYLQEKKKREEAGEEDGPKKKGRKKLFEMTEPRRPTQRQEDLVFWFDTLDNAQQRSVMFWERYTPGSFRLKNREEIPPELLPAIAEISETREGIKIKLHDKMGALDKLARILKMYDGENEEKERVSKINTINLIVNGSKSNLLDQDLGKAS